MNVGVIGLGIMGMNHARVYHDLGAKLVAVADPDEARGALCTRRFGATWTADHRELLARRDVEAVSIAAPTHLHHRIAMEALLAGKHVLIEKPIADTVEKADELVQAGRKQGLVVAVGHIERHNPVVGMAKRVLASGVAGDILSVSSRRVSGGGSRIKDVGVILDLAIHDIDVVRHLVGSEVSAVYAAAGGSPENPAREDRAHIVMEFAGGVFASLEASWRSPTKVRRLALACSKSHLELDYMGQFIDRSTSHVVDADLANLYAVPREYEAHRIAVQNQEPLMNELKDFLAAVAGGRAPLVDGADGREALRIALAAERSARERRRIELDAAP